MFRKLTDTFFAAPQISLSDVTEAKAAGISLIINNRPEDESADQTSGAEIETAARTAGLDYVAIPVTHAGFAEWQVTAMADALPALGIVAAVLGVIKTMGSVGQPPAVLGAMIGSALVGTFLGIFLAYAIAEPLAGVIDQKMEEGTKELQCIKSTLLASMQGYAPATAIEFGRKVLLSDVRPTFNELEAHVKGKK